MNFEWIPFKDKKPEKGGMYLVTLWHHGYEDLTIVKTLQWGNINDPKDTGISSIYSTLNGQCIFEMIKNGGAFIDSSQYCDDADDVYPVPEYEILAWANMPEPYKEKKNENNICL